MKLVIQRVKKASVTIDNELFSHINKGLMVLFGAQKGDTKESIDYLVNKLLKLRIFEDENSKMNLSILDAKGEILAVSQFTLLADCKKGTRPSFDNAMEPKMAKEFYELFVEKLKEQVEVVKTGVFGEHMDVSLVNNGPVTIILEK